jgi:uncharacterized protein YkwD
MTTTYNQLEKEVFALINQVRQNPETIVPNLDNMRKFYDGKYFINQDLKAKMATHEGVSAVNEALDFMYKQESVGSLKRNRALDLAARQMQGYLEKTGKVSAEQENMKMGQRVKMFVKEGGLYAENISFGVVNPVNVMNQFMVSDGISHRIHRTNLMNPRFTHVGIAMGPHKDYGFVCVIQFYGPKSGEKSTLIDLYDEAYDPSIIPKVEGSKSVNIVVQTQIVGNVRHKKFIYKFTLINGEEVVRDYQSQSPV